MRVAQIVIGVLIGIHKYLTHLAFDGLFVRGRIYCCCLWITVTYLDDAEYEITSNGPIGMAAFFRAGCVTAGSGMVNLISQ